MRAHVTHVSEYREQRLAEKEKGTSRGSFIPYVWIRRRRFILRGSLLDCAISAHPHATPRPTPLELRIHQGGISIFKSTPKGSRLLCLSALVRSFLLASPRNATARVTCRLNGLASVAECCNAAITFCVYWLLDGILPDIARDRGFTIHGDDRANGKCVHLAGDVRGLQYRCFMDVSGLM